MTVKNRGQAHKILAQYLSTDIKLDNCTVIIRNRAKRCC